MSSINKQISTGTLFNNSAAPGANEVNLQRKRLFQYDKFQKSGQYFTWTTHGQSIWHTSIGWFVAEEMKNNDKELYSY